MFTTYFTYKPSHQERHYLVNTKSRNNDFLCDRLDKEAEMKAQKFNTEKEAKDALHRKLEKMNYGRDSDYYYTPHIVNLTTSEDKIIWKN